MYKEMINIRIEIKTRNLRVKVVYYIILLNEYKNSFFRIENLR